MKETPSAGLPKLTGLWNMEDLINPNEWAGDNYYEWNYDFWCKRGVDKK